ncbi:MAG TPA: penicillin acylase family protein [Jiangellaceae bacterium]|nr:penicillin acylase family protein [Jiangellaceae bacterium]
MSVGPRHHIALVAAAVTLGASVVAAPAGGQPGPPGSQPGDRAYYVLPPGNYGGLPTTDESRDQIPLYDALTPLRGDVTDADIDAHFLPEDFSPVGATREEPTGRPGTTILYDEYGVAHITGQTRADLAFGAGWVTARDRGLLLQLGRGPARAAVADIPGIDAFGLVTSGQSFVPSAATEQLVSDQVDLLVETYGDKGRQIIADAQAEADGINAYWAAHGIDQPPATVNDVVAVTAFIGSIFGGGGGAEAANAELLATLRAGLGPEVGTHAWEDAMLADDPEAPTTTRRRFNYGPRTGGRVTGSVVVDPGSIQSLDPRQPGPAAPSPSASSAGRLDATYPAAGPVPSREASNFLVVDPRRSATGNTLAVMGPQLGYFYPEIVQQIHLSGPGIEAQGVAVPAAAMYILIGRTRDYAWSLTSANHDVRDVFAEQLCNPEGTPPTRASTHYVFEGTCRPFETFDAGTLNGTPVRYPLSVHGPVIGTATVGGEPYALTRQRSTFGRDALNLAALKDMTEGKADTSRQFFEAANQFKFTFNWAYASRTETAYFSSGLLPRRARGLDRRLPTLGTGDYEWRGFLSQREHPHDVRGPRDLLLNWNNRSAPGFMHGDDAPFGSAHRVELFDQWPRDPTLADTVSVMNRAATEDVRSVVWPVVSRVLRSGAAPSALADRTVAVLDDWVARDAPRLDADLDGDYDDAGPVISDALWQPIADAVMRPVYGDLTDDLADVRSLNGAAGQSYVDKDLRALLGDPVKGRFNLSYCGGGSLDACRASLWAVVEQVAGELAAEQGPEPSSWTGPAARTGFTPGLIPDTIRTTNRPTFQQVLELAGEPRSVR